MSDNPSERKVRWYEPLVMLGLILLLFFLVHGKRMERNLSLSQWEDEYFIEHNDKNMHNLIDCFTERPLWNGLYRPLTTNLYYYLGGELFDHKIETYHAINIFFYILNAFLLYLVCREVLPGF